MRSSLSSRARQATSRLVLSFALFGAAAGTALGPSAAHAAGGKSTPTTTTTRTTTTTTTTNKPTVVSRAAGMGGGGGGILQPCIFGPSMTIYNSGDMASPFAPFMRVDGTCFAPNSTVYMSVRDDWFTPYENQNSYYPAIGVPVSVDANGNFTYLFFPGCNLAGHFLDVDMSSPLVPDPFGEQIAGACL